MKIGKVEKERGQKRYKRINTNVKSIGNKKRRHCPLYQEKIKKLRLKEKKRNRLQRPSCLPFKSNDKVQALKPLNECVCRRLMKSPPSASDFPCG